MECHRRRSIHLLNGISIAQPVSRRCPLKLQKLFACSSFTSFKASHDATVEPQPLRTLSLPTWHEHGCALEQSRSRSREPNAKKREQQWRGDRVILNQSELFSLSHTHPRPER